MNLVESKEHCASVAKTRAKNFYYGMKLVPLQKRDAQFAIYAWNRLADDLADEDGELDAKLASLEQFKSDTKQCLQQRESSQPDLPTGEIWPAFHDALNQYPIKEAYLDAMIEGQLIDQSKTRYATMEELYDYCYKVASVVGLTCIEIWGHEGDARTYQLAEWRGIAFQLTNILRDVKEDAQRDRIYLPQDMHPREITPQMILTGSDDDLVQLITDLANTAEDYYRKSAELDELIDKDGLACMWAMTMIYRGVLDKILANPSVVLGDKRVSLGSLRKIWIALSASRMKG